MTDLAPLQTLYEYQAGEVVPLPGDLATLYGSLRFPRHEGRPHVYGNFVTTMDGVVSLNEQNLAGGGEISGFNRHDQMVMGILRAVADAVVVGAGTLRAVPRHLWTPDHVFPGLSESYNALRSALGKEDEPLNVIISGSGQVDLRLPVFTSGKVRALVVTTEEGMASLRDKEIPPSVKLAAVRQAGPIAAADVLAAIEGERRTERVLVEGGPHVMGDFFAEGKLDELFLTLAPQVAGRDNETTRPGLVEGVLFAPHQPLWGRLEDVRRAESHLLLRYAFTGGW